MSYDTLVILCETTDGALRAGQRVSLIPDILRVFLFVGDAIDEAELDWISEPDIFLQIEHAKSWSKDVSALGIRVGIGYTDGANIYVCNSSLCPSVAEINQARKICDSPTGSIITSKLKGISREYFVLYYEPAASTEIAKRNLGPEIAKAMRGEEAIDEAVIEAILETASLSPCTFLNTPKQHASLQNIHKMMYTATFGRTLPNANSKIFYGENISPKELKETIEKTNVKGCVVFILVREQESLFDLSKSYRRFKTPNCLIAIFKGEQK